MSFKLNLVTDLPTLEQVNTDNGRFYSASDGSIETPYPSVTTVLGADPKKEEGIRKWRERVGEDEANRVSHVAAQAGTAVHQIMEDWILGQEPKTKPMPIHLAKARGLKNFAEIYIDNVMLVEGQLFSHELRTAGTVDLVAEWQGKPAIIDWKTSRYPKKRNYITNYFMQEAAYAVMFEERTGIKIEKLVTLVAYEDGNQMFVEEPGQWIPEFKKIREMYDTQLQSNFQSQVAGAVV